MLRFNKRQTTALMLGSLGQIGSGLVALLKRNGATVLGVDIGFGVDRKGKRGSSTILDQQGTKYCDVTDIKSLQNVLLAYKPTWVIHLSALLSGASEQELDRAFKVNIMGFQNILNLARKLDFRLFAPSSIATFGPHSPKVQTPDQTIMRPTTIYGISKLYLELMGEYYHQKFGIDFRSLRLPGVISPDIPKGLGTTDYAIEMFHHLAKTGTYTCFIAPDLPLPMVWLDDCLDGILQFISTPSSSLTRRVYNINAMSFTPQDLFASIRNQCHDRYKNTPSITHHHSLSIVYKPDFRMAIAKTWPHSLDDSIARQDWGWSPKTNLKKMVSIMLDHTKV